MGITFSSAVFRGFAAGKLSPSHSFTDNNGCLDLLLTSYHITTANSNPIFNVTIYNRISCSPIFQNIGAIDLTASGGTSPIIFLYTMGSNGSLQTRIDLKVYSNWKLFTYLFLCERIALITCRMTSVGKKAPGAN